MATYTFDDGDLQELLKQVVAGYLASDNIQQAVDNIMAGLTPDDWGDDAQVFENDPDFIPWDGTAWGDVYNDDGDNISPAALGLQEAM